MDVYIGDYLMSITSTRSRNQYAYLTQRSDRILSRGPHESIHLNPILQLCFLPVVGVSHQLRRPISFFCSELFIAEKGPFRKQTYQVFDIYHKVSTVVLALLDTFWVHASFNQALEPWSFLATLESLNF